MLSKEDRTEYECRILKVVQIVGVATRAQIQRMNFLDRTSLVDYLDALVSAKKIRIVPAKRNYYGNVSGRPSVIYQLTELGAAFLRDECYQVARASGLKDDLAIYHALGMLDVR